MKELAECGLWKHVCCGFSNQFEALGAPTGIEVEVEVRPSLGLLPPASSLPRHAHPASAEVDIEVPSLLPLSFRPRAKVDVKVEVSP